MVVYIIQLYPPLGRRHSLWLFPLYVPLVGSMLADTLERVRHSRRHVPKLIMGGALILIVVCDTGKQYLSINLSEEYSAWQSITKELDKMGPKDVIITDKDGANLLINTYRYKSDEQFMNGNTPVLAPYHNTHILISPDYFDDYNPKMLNTMLQEAQSQHLLDHIDRLAFVKAWERLPLYDIITCQMPTKESLFPPAQSGYELAPNKWPFWGFALIAVSKPAFFDDVVSPSGSEHSCLSEQKRTKEDFGYYTPRSAKHFAP